MTAKCLTAEERKRWTANMKILNLLLPSALLLDITALSQDASKLPSRNEILKTIEVFASSPLSPEGKEAAATIAKFAEYSHDVSVVISPGVAPWLGSGEPPETQ